MHNSDTAAAAFASLVGFQSNDLARGHPRGERVESLSPRDSRSGRYVEFLVQFPRCLGVSSIPFMGRWGRLVFPSEASQECGA